MYGILAREPAGCLRCCRAEYLSDGRAGAGFGNGLGVTARDVYEDADEVYKIQHGSSSRRSIYTTTQEETPASVPRFLPELSTTT